MPAVAAAQWPSVRLAESCYLSSCSLKEDKVIVVALNPGWVDTDMGSAAGEEVGMKPPLNPPTSIAGQQRVIAGLKLEDSGRFVDFEKGGDIPY